MDINKLIPFLLEQQRGITASSGSASSTIYISRPKWDDVYRNYPKNASGNNDMFGPDFYKILFGKRYDLKTNLLDGKTSLYNGCAAKVSTALTLANFPIVKTNGIGRDFIATEGNMKDKGFISTASKMKRWLDAIWKNDGDFHVDNPSSIEELKALVGTKKGIYLMIASDPKVFEASGHVTLWTGKPGEQYVFGGHHYEESAKAMYFWELK